MHSQLKFNATAKALLHRLIIQLQFPVVNPVPTAKVVNLPDHSDKQSGGKHQPWSELTPPTALMTLSAHGVPVSGTVLGLTNPKKF